MSRELAANVILVGEDGQPIFLPAGSVPSEQQAAEITNPAAWGDEVVPPEVPEPEPEAAEAPAPEPVVEPEPEVVAESHEDEATDVDVKPAKRGLRRK